MWESLANDPWPVFGVLFAAACLAAWWSRRSGSKAAFAVALVLLVAALVPLFAGLFVDTPMKQVDRVVRELVAAGEARNHRRIVDALDPNYNHGGFTKEKLGQLIERELTNFRPDYVSLQDLVIEATPEKATANFRAATGGRYEGQGVGVTMPRYLVRLKLHFVKRDGRWRVTEIRRYDPQIAQEQEISLGAHR
jgi:hypothetical protein